MRDYKGLKVNYFNKIDTKDKAYWLGFLYADGAIDRKGTRLLLNLAIKDESQIDRFLSAIGLEPEMYKKYYGPYSNTGRFVQIYIIHREFVENLIKHGCINKKSFTIRFPELNDELAAAFLLGYYDGDGTASCADICCGSNAFLVDIKTRFNIKFNIRQGSGSTFYLNLGASLKKSLVENYPYSMDRKKSDILRMSKEEYAEKIRQSYKAKRKFEISKEDLEKLLNEKPLTHIGKMFGVTDNAIKKRAKRLGIVRVCRKYNYKKNKEGALPPPTTVGSPLGGEPAI